MAIGWKLHEGPLGPNDVVAPDERLSWGKTAGLGAQHVVAMFGATFVFPLLMGLNAQLAIMMSGIATICFLLIVKGKVPSYLGSSASFVGAVAAVRAQGGDSSTVTGAILVSGLVLALVGISIHFLGSGIIHKVLPPVVTGAVVMLIGFNLAPVVANVYWPQDQWVALLVMVFAIACAVGLRGFFGRISIFLALLFGTVLSWVFDRVFGMISSLDPGTGKITDHFRVNWDGVTSAPWIGFPPHTSMLGGKEIVGWHTPTLSMAAILLVLPAVIALIAENTGHVKAVAEMTGADLDGVMGKAIAADGFGTVLASAVGGSPTTTYAENIGVMAATRVYSTAAYYVAALVAIVFGLSPKFGALVAATPGRRPRRDHGDPVRHDRPARREDLERERRRLRQPDQPGPGGCRHRHRHRQHEPGVQQDLQPQRYRLRHHRGHRGLSHGPGPGSPAHEGQRRRCAPVGGRQGHREGRAQRPLAPPAGLIVIFRNTGRSTGREVRVVM